MAKLTPENPVNHQKTEKTWQIAGGIGVNYKRPIYSAAQPGLITAMRWQSKERPEFASARKLQGASELGSTFVG
jgi:hypothetical protein